jgi:putative ABC transport system permease protein
VRGEYVRWAWRDMRPHPGLFAVVVCTIAVGIAVPSVLVSCWSLLVQDPAPGRSSQVYHVQLDARDEASTALDSSGRLPEQLTYIDAEGLVTSGPASASVGFYEFSASAQAEVAALPNPVTVGATHAAFFRMFGAQIAFGSAWSRADGENRARVVVISGNLNDQLFNGSNSVGRDVFIDGMAYKVVGVLQTWRPPTKFFAASIYSPMNEAYIPYETAIQTQASPISSVQCANEAAGALPDLARSECAWINFWVELATAADRSEYERFLGNYVAEQRKLGRLPKDQNIWALNNAREWVRYVQTGTDVRSALLSASVAGLVLMSITIANAIALLLAKFMQGASTVALQRAVGASRRDVLVQHLTECGLVGAVAAVLGMVLSLLTLAWARGLLDTRLQQYGFSLEATSQLNWQICITAMLFGIVGAVAAGLYPSWLVSRVEPAAFLNRS